MAYAQDGALVAYNADADYSVDGTGQYRAVKRTATGIVLCGAADVGFLGILQDDPAAGEAGTVKTRDVSKAVIGAAVVAGARLTTDANARLITAVAGNTVVAWAMEPGGASGDVIAVEVGVAGVVAA